MIDSMKVFCMVVEKKGFRTAASELDISPAMVTRHIGKLEHQLKTPLLKRNTRSVTLTDTGQLFYHRCGDIVSLYEQCLNQVSAENHTLSGNLKVGVPHSINQLHIVPALGNFYRANPNMTLDIIAGNHSLELFSHGYDLALHCGPLPDSTLYYTLIGYWEKHTVASPDYLEKNGIPKHPDDLQNHNCLLHFDNQFRAWKYSIENNSIEVSVFGQTRINNSLDLYQMAKQGLGIAYLPAFTVNQALADQSLVSVLEAFMPPPLPMYVVHINPTPSKREQAFIEFVKSLPLTMD